MHRITRTFFLALPLALAFACDAPGDGLVEEAGFATAAPSTALAAAATAAASVSLPDIEFDAAKAQHLCTIVKQGPQFSALLAQAAQHGVSDAVGHAIANELCKFYAAPTAEKVAYWDGLLVAFVADGRLTSADQAALDSALVDPRLTMAEWNPQTNFGVAVLSGYEDNEPEANASTAGDVGTIAGAIIGGLGGTPASVGLGAAIGRVMGEAANALGNYWSDLAPDEEPGGEEGGETGSAEGGEEGGT